MGGGALGSKVSKLVSKEVSKICHLERSERSQSNEILRLKPQNDSNFSLAPWGEGVRRTGEGSKVKIAQQVRDDKLRHPELVSGSQMQERSASSCNNKTLSRISKFTAFTKKFYPLPEVEGKSGFTLAEVLITLGIIGVVAALTLPSVIQSYKKQVTVNQLKKAYSTLGQVAQKAFADNGPVGVEVGSKLNADDVKDFFNTYWLPYFKGAQVYPEHKQPILNESKGYYADCYKRLDGVYEDMHVFTNYGAGRVFFSSADGMTYFIYMLDWGNKKYDENGNLISQDALYAPYQRVYVDVNGIKPPNTFGKDVFTFMIDFDKGFVRPIGYGSNQASLDDHCKTSGTTCATKIIRDGWKINY